MEISRAINLRYGFDALGEEATSFHDGGSAAQNASVAAKRQLHWVCSYLGRLNKKRAIFKVNRLTIDITAAGLS